MTHVGSIVMACAADPSAAATAPYLDAALSTKLVKGATLGFYTPIIAY